jgi:chemotaxis methyl-accepting protein methylase
MIRGVYAQRFKHIIFPREEMRRGAVNLAPYAPPTEYAETFCAAWSKEEMEFVSWLLGRAGLESRDYRPETLQRRLPACLRILRANSVAQARELLEQSPATLGSAISAILVGVTSFFRDASVFEQLGKEIQRATADRAQGVYAWSIGCSEGAELYSLGMMLADRGILADSYLLGTDCRTDAIERARNAVFDTSLTRHVPAELLTRYFERNGNCLQITAELRQALRWRVSSILREIESGLWDVIFFRNTALYLRPEAVLSVWPKLEAALRPGGLLVLGRAERPYGVHRLRAIGPCLYRRHHR